MSAEDSELDPRIKIELENLNTATDEINKLEIELEEANSTFRILLNESTRRLKLSSKKLGSCIDKARPYYEALDKSRVAQVECQKAAVKFQRANEIHAAAKETVALAEQRFMSNSHEWNFDNAWQEMLNHATQKVMDAEKQKADCHLEHQRLTRIFHAAEQKVQQLEERYRRSIVKSRPYFEEKQICQDQLQTQKNRIEELQAHVQTAKSTYATALRNLERISDDIHRQRGDYPHVLNTPPPGPREPGVGAELNSPTSTTMPSLPDFHMELEKCDYPSIAGSQMSLSGRSEKSNGTTAAAGSSSCSSSLNRQNHQLNYYHNSAAAVAAPLAILASAEADSEIDDEDDVVIQKHNSYTASSFKLDQLDLDDQTEDYNDSSELSSSAGIVDEKDLEALRQKVKFLAVRPIEVGDGQQQQNDVWEHELNATVDKLDHLMLLKECAKKQQELMQQKSLIASTAKLNYAARPDSLGAEEIKKPAVKNATAVGNAATTAATAAVLPTIQVTASSNTIENSSLPNTPEHFVKPLKKLHKLEPLPMINVSMRELPLLARLSTEILDQSSGYNRQQQRRRSLD